MSSIEFDREASSCGACCPMPLIVMEKAIKTMHPGQVLKMVGDDPVFEEGVRDYCSVKGYRVIAVETADDRKSIYIRV